VDDKGVLHAAAIEELIPHQLAAGRHYLQICEREVA
jgi:hypothetical protein